MAEKRTTYKIQDVGGIGEVKIADEVVTIIAALAATEVEGVASMGGNITNELVSKLGMKNLSKGVKVTFLFRSPYLHQQCGYLHLQPQGLSYSQ